MLPPKMLIVLKFDFRISGIFSREFANKLRHIDHRIRGLNIPFSCIIFRVVTLLR
jgi:hypothetical protein